jgi:hypothetical protein
MAGDWIKMRGNLWDDPRVSRLCDLTDQPEAMVIGALYWLWSSADSHTEDGLMPGLSLKGIDRKSGVPGFGKALLDVGWIAEVEGGIAIVRFDEHNGKSAKRRSMEAKRKGEVRKVSASDADKSKTESGKDAELELEKELEKEKDKKSPPVSPQGGKAKRAAQLPEDFEPNETNKRLAEELGVSLITEFPQFCDHHRAKGSTMKDWHAAMNTWIRNAHRFGRSGNRQAQQGRKETPQERGERMARERGLA